jgi:FMN phosphatase YigB (HAD superfamily)
VGASIAIVTDSGREEVAKLIEPLGLEIAIDNFVTIYYYLARI